MTIQNHVFLINTNYSDKYFARVEISARMKLKRYTSNVYKFDGGVIVIYKFDDAEHVNKRDECWFLYILSVALFYLFEKLNRQRYLLMIQVHLMKRHVIHFYTGHAISTGNINFLKSFWTMCYKDIFHIRYILMLERKLALILAFHQKCISLRFQFFYVHHWSYIWRFIYVCRDVR